MRKSLPVILFIIIGISSYFIISGRAKIFPPIADTSLSNFEKIRITHQLEREGRALVRQGLYTKAEQKFIEADDPKYWLHKGRPNGMARGWLRDVYGMQGKYEVILKNLALENPKIGLTIISGYQPRLDEKVKYEALIKYRDELREEPIREVIKVLKTQYLKLLPPQDYDSIASLRPISTILRLYNTIGDHDAGIAYIDECMAYFKQQDIKKYGEYRPGKADREYLKVREAFEQDKAEGFKGCAGKKPGEVCMGRATKAIIQSDYFPW